MKLALLIVTVPVWLPLFVLFEVVVLPIIKGEW
jgi:hypothetical protein